MYQAVQISLHLLCDDVDLRVVCLVVWLLDINQLDDVLVVEELCICINVVYYLFVMYLLNIFISRRIRFASITPSKAI